MKTSILTLLLLSALATSETATHAIKITGEPPAASINKGDVEDKSDKEKEEQAQEIQ